MSHSRIFELSTEPITKDEYVTESTFYDGFVGSVADYVDGNTDREEDIKWLLYVVEGYGVTYNKENQSIIFNEDFKLNYFKEKFESFKIAAHNITFEQFAGVNSMGLGIYTLKNYIEDKYGFYIYKDGLWSTLDSFVRDLKEGVTYYIGAIIDYHY